MTVWNMMEMINKPGVFATETEGILKYFSDFISFRCSLHYKMYLNIYFLL